MDNITCNINRRGDIHWMYNSATGPCNHNNNGPALESTVGYNSWWVNDKRHRLDGPAIEYPGGNKDWYIHNVHYNNELEYWIAVEKYVNAYE